MPATPQSLGIPLPKGWRRLRSAAIQAISLAHASLLLLPKGFKRVRHYGFLANRCRQEKLQLCRELIATMHVHQTPSLVPTASLEKPVWCPECKRGRMFCVLVFKSVSGLPDALPRKDSS